MNKIDKHPKKGGLTVLRPEDNFRFACHKELECFTECCRNTTIFLTPYDILRMKNALGISSEDFLRTYTNTLIGKDSGLPVVVLRMGEDEEKSCPFVTPEGCTIYDDRPWSCRMYPLQPESTNITEKASKEYYSIVDAPFCLGLEENRVVSVEEWKEEQGIPIYIEMEQLFKRITLSEHLKGKEIRNRKIQDMFYMASYDLDRFKRFVFDSKFLDVFDVDSSTVEKIRRDELELLKFAFRWLEFGLIGQHVLKVKPDVLEAKKQELGIK